MKKIGYFFGSLFFVFIFFSFAVNRIYAGGEFTTDFEVTYSLNDNGITNVKNKIILTNFFTDLYATSYSIILNGINPENVISYDQEGKKYAVEITKNDEEFIIKIIFPDRIVGKGKSRIFWVEYNEKSFALKTGEVWEISIPRLSENSSFDSYFVNLHVPEKLGQEAYISPNYRNKSLENGLYVYKFNKEDVEKTGIVAGFGKFQVFNFNLNYHLENPLSRSSQVEIALPPDTAYQKIHYKDINPKPVSISVDSDGNWMASFDLKSRERIDVSASGYVQIFATQRPFPGPSEETLADNLKPQKYWETNDFEIKNLAATLKTPKAIYDYVAGTLKYDYARVRPNVERLGAKAALSSLNSAICMEFTDLFIAIARAAGIPAREVNGYAYTENPEIQPLSLVNDVLHAWPEYFDYQKNTWVPVDPTWGSTTDGIDYFNKLDLRHFAFVMHGKSSTMPYPAGSYKLGSNPQKDVYVSFASLPLERNPDIQILAKLDNWLPLISNRLNIKILNNGPSAAYNLTARVYFDDVLQADEDNTIDVLPPFSNFNYSVDIPFSFLAVNTPQKVAVSVDGKKVDILTNKNQVLIYNLLFIFAVSFTVLITVIIRLKKWKFPKKTF